MDINAIIEASKKMLLEHGQHYPVVYTTFQGNDPDGQCCILPDIMTAPTTMARKTLLFMAGRGLGQRKSDRDIAALCLVNEAWGTAHTSAEEAENAPDPSKDPERKEALVFIMLEVTPGEEGHKDSFGHTGRFFEIIRAGDSIDLLPYGEEASKVRSPLLPSFLAGFQSAKLSDEQLGSLVAKVSPGMNRRQRRAALRELKKGDQTMQFLDI